MLRLAPKQLFSSVIMSANDTVSSTMENVARMSSAQLPMAYIEKNADLFFLRLVCQSWGHTVWYLSNLWHNIFQLAVKGLWQREIAGLAAYSIFASLLLVIVSWHHLGFSTVPLPPLSVVCWHSLAVKRSHREHYNTGMIGCSYLFIQQTKEGLDLWNEACMQSSFPWVVWALLVHT